ncbi:hypothetical protein EHE19_008470 [Ruminiclostridium herbifermentans]|uniref:3D domain-containing protein n=1 Tax=Ruminiclostridium herbifermentans TaxID=2488810 RepID=A0A4U7JL47_9FIRM|nr:3D domain-containing protein [Ruminiclostridium herbifermentans]QNU68420.1 hypothetical protein EHE19_008470 [Ruminiclostridium herbifermentans]
MPNNKEYNNEKSKSKASQNENDMEKVFKDLEDIFSENGPLAKVGEALSQLKELNIDLFNMLSNPNNSMSTKTDVPSDRESTSTKKKVSSSTKGKNKDSEGTDTEKGTKGKGSSEKESAGESMKIAKPYMFTKPISEGGMNYIINGENLNNFFGQWKASLTGSGTDGFTQWNMKVHMDFTITEEGIGLLSGCGTICVRTITLKASCDIDMGLKVTGTTKLIANENGNPQLILDTQCPELSNNFSLEMPKVRIDKSLPFCSGGNWPITLELNKVFGVFRFIENQHGDDLPIIPKEEKVINSEVLYRKKAKLTLTKDNQPISGIKVCIKSSRKEDKIIYVNDISDEKGEIVFNIETRKKGKAEIFVDEKDKIVYAKKETVTFNEAWYEEMFMITKYYIPVEKEFKSGKAGKGKNTMTKVGDEMHNSEFLAETRENGTGLAEGADGSDYYIDSKFKKKELKDLYRGRYGNVEARKTIAADPLIIPPLHNVYIKPLGKVKMVDIGGAIKNYRIDYFAGEGIDSLNSVKVLGEVLMDPVPGRNDDRKKQYFAYVKYLGTK